MKKYMYITRDLDNLERTEHELEAEGISRSNIQVMSENEAALYLRDLPSVPDFSKLDVYRYGARGLMAGIAISTAILAIVWAVGMTAAGGWLPFIFLAIVVLGFCTWEGVLMGLHKTNGRFEKFKSSLDKGAHLLIVNVDKKEVPKVQYSVGEEVKITDGPFLNLTGRIDEIDPDRGKLKVSVSIFGRFTPVELEYWQVERLADEQ